MSGNTTCQLFNKQCLCTNTRVFSTLKNIRTLANYFCLKLRVEGTKVLLARIVARLDENFVYQAENLSPRKRWDSAERKKVAFLSSWQNNGLKLFLKEYSKFLLFLWFLSYFRQWIVSRNFNRVLKEILKNFALICIGPERLTNNI